LIHYLKVKPLIESTGRPTEILAFNQLSQSINSRRCLVIDRAYKQGTKFSVHGSLSSFLEWEMQLCWIVTSR